MRINNFKIATYKHKYLMVRIRLTKTLKLWVRDNTTQREIVQQAAANVARDMSKQIDKECKQREWQHHYRIPVVDQGGRVIGYRYLNGDEKK